MTDLAESLEEFSSELNLVMSPDAGESPRSQPTSPPDIEMETKKEEKTSNAPETLASLSFTLKDSDIMNTKRIFGSSRKRSNDQHRKKVDNVENDTPPGSSRIQSSPRDSLASVGAESTITEEKKRPCRLPAIKDRVPGRNRRPRIHSLESKRYSPKRKPSLAKNLLTVSSSEIVDVSATPHFSETSTLISETSNSITDSELESTSSKVQSKEDCVSSSEIQKGGVPRSRGRPRIHYPRSTKNLAKVEPSSLTNSPIVSPSGLSHLTSTETPSSSEKLSTNSKSSEPVKTRGRSRKNLDTTFGSSKAVQMFPPHETTRFPDDNSHELRASKNANSEKRRARSRTGATDLMATSRSGSVSPSVMSSPHTSQSEEGIVMKEKVKTPVSSPKRELKKDSRSKDKSEVETKKLDNSPSSISRGRPCKQVKVVLDGENVVASSLTSIDNESDILIDKTSRKTVKNTTVIPTSNKREERKMSEGIALPLSSIPDSKDLSDSDSKMTSPDSNLDRSVNTDYESPLAATDVSENNSVFNENKVKELAECDVRQLRRSLKETSNDSYHPSKIMRRSISTGDTKIGENIKRSTRSSSTIQKENTVQVVSKSNEKKEKQEKNEGPRVIDRENTNMSEKRIRKRKLEARIDKADKKTKLAGDISDSSVKVAEQVGLSDKKKTTALTLMKSVIIKRKNEQKERKAIHNERERKHGEVEEKRLKEEKVNIAESTPEPRLKKDSKSTDKSEVETIKSDEKPLTPSEKLALRREKRAEWSRKRRAQIKAKKMEEAAAAEAAQARRRELKRIRNFQYNERIKAEKLAKRKENDLKRKEQRKARENLRATKSRSTDGYEINLSDEDLPLATISRHIKNPLQVPETPRRREILEVDHIPDFRLRRPMEGEYPDRDEIFLITSADLASSCRIPSHPVGYESDSDAPLSIQVKKKAPVQLQLHNNRMGRGKPRVAGATPEIRMEKIEKELEKLNKRWIMLSEEARSLFPELPESAVTRKVQKLIRCCALKV